MYVVPGNKCRYCSAGLQGPVAPTRCQQREQMIIGVSCIFQNPAGSGLGKIIFWVVFMTL